MKKLIIAFLLLMCISFPEAKNNWFFHVGGTVSDFRDSHNLDDIKSINGFFYGFGREWSISDNFLISAELKYSVKGAILENKRIQPVYFINYEVDIYRTDIICKIGFLEVPIHAKHSFTLKYFDLKVYAGFSYSIPYRDLTKLEEKELWLSNINPYDYRHLFEYQRWEDSGFGNNHSDFIYDFGIEIVYKHYGISFMYSYDSRYVWWFDSISEVHKNMYSIHLSLLIYL